MLIAGMLAALVAAQAPQPCARPTGTVQALASLELADKIAARDSVAVVRVCIATKDPAVRIGSYHGLVTWDSAAAKLEAVEKGRMGMRIENTTKAGAVDFAGAFPAGLNDTIALTLRLSLTKPGKLPVLKLHMFELNEVTGTILTSQLRVTGYPVSVRSTPGPLKADSAIVAANRRIADSARGISSTGGSTKVNSTGAPRITSITQLNGGRGDPVQAVIRGTGFAPTGNTVVFESMELTNLPSADGGTMIRFTIPEEFPSKSEVAPLRVGTGEYQIEVKNPRGKSNAMKFRVSMDGRL